MQPSDAQLTAGQVLQTFQYAAPFLFIGAALATIGLVAGAVVLLRRQRDTMLISFALFSFLYGMRLWLQSPILSLVLPPTHLFFSLKSAFNFLVGIPAFFYFSAAGFSGKWGRPLAYTVSVILGTLVIATLIIGPRDIFDTISNVIIIISLILLLIQSLRRKALDRDAVLIRYGLVIFIAFALFSNIANTFSRYLHIEPIGFTIFVVVLGYVAARRAFHRDERLAEIQKELDIARHIQMANLPATNPTSTSFQIATRYVPMTSVAGDLYDFLIADDHHAGLLIADVAGHGVPAALIASMVKLAASSHREQAEDPAALLTAMNTTLCGNTQNQFVTSAYVFLDAASRIFRYAAAAHPPMLLVRDGEILEITENGLMLAAFSFAEFTTLTQDLHPGDRIVLYTDGIIEATNADLEEFGQQRLHALLREHLTLSADQIADHIVTTVKQWSPRQDDDLTILICDYTPTTLHPAAATA